ncbi:winged helix-turn-helix domain-containing tetratricopeptide repeat protein [Elioraea sp. Yellowstone]|uniref:winged helix-turn-helix domain-containing tetratricopeptide repeat protein n=1 Tax=Elioraea sp. Yellowstone TaxID=2592070 RepID=UPI00138737BB|nr:winged helix-turn-helix domain-containing protein [Elioraea sp. Yellowstone]
MDLAFAGYEIDLDRHELRHRGETVHVEPQVFDLLVHLVRNRDRVVSKDELFETIWQGRFVSEAALSSRINAARKAVGDDGNRQALIKTIHKRGFRFVGEVETREGEAAPATTAAALAEPALLAAVPGGSRCRPSIAVLPFTNLSQDPDTDYFSYGLTEDIVRMLARHRWMDVLSRHSAAGLDPTRCQPRELGAALGVRYLVQGSVAKRGERVRITADLVSAETARQLWSDAYDFVLPDIFTIQEAMAQQIAAVIEPELSRIEREAAARRPPADLNAWDCYQRGLFHLWGFTTPGMVEAEAMFRRAIELDPSFARAHGALSYVHLQNTVLGDPAAREGHLREAMAEGRVAVALDNQDSMNLCVLGRAHCFRHEYSEAIALLEQAIALNPSFGQAFFALGFTLTCCGQAEEALAHFERAAELSPRDPHLSSFYAMRALAHLALGEYEATVAFARKGMRLPNAKHWPVMLLASALGLLGRTAEAGPAVAELIRRHPGYNLGTARSDFFFCGDVSLVERCIEGLRRAGVPAAVEPSAQPAG